MRLGSSTDKKDSGRLHVDFAQARDDFYEWECKQRMRAREERHRRKLEEDRLRPPSPPAIMHYSEHEAALLADKLKGRGPPSRRCPGRGGGGRDGPPPETHRDPRMTRPRRLGPSGVLSACPRGHSEAGDAWLPPAVRTEPCPFPPVFSVHACVRVRSLSTVRGKGRESHAQQPQRGLLLPTCVARARLVSPVGGRVLEFLPTWTLDRVPLDARGKRRWGLWRVEEKGRKGSSPSEMELKGHC